MKFKLAASLASLLILCTDANALTFVTVGDSLTAGLFKQTGYIYCPPTGEVFTDPGDAVCNGNGAKNRGGYQPFVASKIGATLYNYGISSGTSAQVLDIASAVARVSADYMIIMAGTNDVIQGVPVNRIVRNIQAMVDIAKANKKVPLVLTIPPLSYSGYDHLNGQVVALNKALKSEVSANVIDTYSVLARNWPGNHSGDRIHLNDIGNELIAIKIVEDYQNPPQPGGGIKKIPISPIINMLLLEN